MAPKRVRGEASQQGEGQPQVTEASLRATAREYGFTITSPTQLANFRILYQQKLSDCKFIDWDFCDTIGIRGNVQFLLDRLGLTNFVNLQYGAHLGMTMEFLTSFMVNYELEDLSNGPELSFRLCGVQKNITLRTFNRALRLPFNEGLSEPQHPDFNVQLFYSSITCDRRTRHARAVGSVDYDPSNSKASNFCNMVFRYVHRVLLNMVFPRGENKNNAQINDLFLLWAGFHGVQVNIGEMLINYFLQIQRYHPNLACGHLITALAHGLRMGNRVDRLQLTPAGLLDASSMRQSSILSVRPDIYHYIHHGQEIYHLPQASRIDIHNLLTWSCDTYVDEDEPQHLPPVRHDAPGYSRGPTSSSQEYQFDPNDVSGAFAHLSGRFDHMENRFDHLESRFDQMEGRFDNFYQQQQDMWELQRQFFQWQGFQPPHGQPRGPPGPPQ